jgi:AbrB family looped-hinge helix DNA binding protein
MLTKVSTKGQVVLPGPIRRKLDIRAGDPLNVTIENDRIVLTRTHKPKFEARIVQDPITGFTSIDMGPDAPVLTSEMVEELLAEFP